MKKRPRSFWKSTLSAAALMLAGQTASLTWAADITIDFATNGDPGNLGTSDPFVDEATGLRVQGLYLVDGIWQDANLYRRDQGPSDHGFGVCNPAEMIAGGGDCPGPDGGGDINELDNFEQSELITLMLPPGYEWVSVWVSSMDNNFDGPVPERGQLWVDADGEPNSTDPGGVGDTVISQFTGGEDPFEVEFEIPIDAADANAPYLMFEPFDHSPSGENTDNDYLVFQATIRELQVQAALGDRVWEDLNVNGIQDCNDDNGNGIIGDSGDSGPECDAGIAGITVILRNPVNASCDTSAPEIADTTTDANGFYLFDDLSPGDYCVEFVKPSAEFCGTDEFDLGDPQFTLLDRGDDARDSDAEPDNGSGFTGIINLGPNEFDLTNDAGIYCPAKLGDRVWEDVDGDGIQDCQDTNGNGIIGDSGDTGPECGAGISGVAVELFECGPDGVAGTGDDVETEQTRTTDDNGFYMFGAEPGGFDLEPGRYFVRFFDPEGREFTTPNVGDGGDDDDENDSVSDSDCLATDLDTAGNTSCTTLESLEVNLRRDCGLITPPPECDLLLDKKCRAEPRPTTDFDKCKGKLQEFTVIWNGNRPITVNGLGQSNLSVDPGDEVTFFGSGGNDVEVSLSGAANGQSTFHLSCSDKDFNDPSDCGKAAGNGKKDKGGINDWLLEGFVDKEGRVLDCTGDSDDDFADSCTVSPGRGPSCDTIKKPDTLTWRYDGGSNGDGNCSDSTFPTATNRKGKTHKDFKCSGGVDVSQAVTVTLDKGKGGSQTVQPGEEFTTGLKESKRLSLSGGGSQNLEFHTSCSQPIEAGLTAGALTLVALDGQRGSTTVTYQYEVTNNGDPVSGINLTDDQLGDIAGGLFNLDTGESREFTKKAVITGATVNTGIASGELSDGTQCSDSDTVTVEGR